MDACDIANFLAQELLLHQLVSLEGLHSGVPTRTTPTLTPTTLRSIEQTFIELQCEPLEHISQAGFVPPPASLPQAADLTSYMDISRNIELDRSSMSSSWQSPPPQDAPPQTTRRNMGGRRPNRPPNISPEEEERRSVRRERNKMAAARCRKRRMDHTNELIEETEELEKKRQTLQGEIQDLQQQKDELEFLLEAHRACCRRQATLGLGSRPNSPPDVKPLTALLSASDPPRIKSEPFEKPPSPKRIMLASASPEVIKINSITPVVTTSNAPLKPNRPNFLNVPLTIPPSQQHNLKKSITEIAGIPITTPSTGIPFNFDSLMDGGTGLTPVSAPMAPSCSSQQRHQPVVDPNGSLETPTQNKLVSL